MAAAVAAADAAAADPLGLLGAGSLSAAADAQQTQRHPKSEPRRARRSRATARTL